MIVIFAEGRARQTKDGAVAAVCQVYLAIEEAREF